MEARDDEAVVIDQHGKVRVEGDGMKARLAGAAGRYRVFAPGGNLMLLERSELQRESTQERGRLLMAGEIVSRTTVLEVMGFAAQTQWCGELRIAGPSGSRSLQIADGALKGAGSVVPSERLGEVMVATGMITADQLARCVLDASPTRRFGEIAVDKGYTNREQLFEALRSQMQRIFQNALVEEAGHYLMWRRADDDEAAEVPALMLHLPIQGLLMEGVQRIDEMALFRRRIPSGEVCPVQSGRAATIAVTDSLRPVLGLSDGSHSILEIARTLRLDEYQATKRVCQLMQIGVLELKPQQALDAAEIKNMIARFNPVLRRIFAAVEREGKPHDMQWTLDAWIRDTTLNRYFEDTLSAEGLIYAERVVQKLAQAPDKSSLEGLHEALHELAAFALLSAGSVLPRDSERALSHAISRSLSQLRGPAR